MSFFLDNKVLSGFCVFETWTHLVKGVHMLRQRVYQVFYMDQSVAV